MKKMKLNKETQEVLTEAEELSLGVKGNFWKIIKGKMVQRITDLNDIMNLDITSQNIALEIKVHQLVVAEFIDLIKEIEGGAKSNEYYQEAFKNEKREGYLYILDDN